MHLRRRSAGIGENLIQRAGRTGEQGRALIRVAGPDARPFLHNLLTQDVETLAPGELRFGALLSPPGRLLFDLFLWGEDEAVSAPLAASWQVQPKRPVARDSTSDGKPV